MTLTPLFLDNMGEFDQFIYGKDSESVSDDNSSFGEFLADADVANTNIAKFIQQKEDEAKAELSKAIASGSLIDPKFLRAASDRGLISPEQAKMGMDRFSLELSNPTPGPQPEKSGIQKVMSGLGSGMARSGRYLTAAAADIGDMWGESLTTGRLPTTMYKNVRALTASDDMTPDEKAFKESESGVGKFLQSGARATVEMLPAIAISGGVGAGLGKLGAATGMKLLGSPVTAFALKKVGETVAPGLVFGTTPDGFDKNQAALMTVVPFIGRYGGRVAESVAKKFGVGNDKALAIVNTLGHAGSIATVFAADLERQLALQPELTPEQLHDARVEGYGAIFGMTAFGMQGDVKNIARKFTGPLEKTNFAGVRATRVDDNNFQIDFNNWSTRVRFETPEEHQVYLESLPVGSRARASQARTLPDGTILMARPGEGTGALLSHEMIHVMRSAGVIDAPTWQRLVETVDRKSPEYRGAVRDYFSLGMDEATKARGLQGVEAANYASRYVDEEYIARKFEGYREKGNAPKSPLLTRMVDFAKGIKGMDKVLGKPSWDKPIAEMTGDEVAMGILSGRLRKSDGSGAVQAGGVKYSTPESQALKDEARKHNLRFDGEVHLGGKPIGLQFTLMDKGRETSVTVPTGSTPEYLASKVAGARRAYDEAADRHAIKSDDRIVPVLMIDGKPHEGGRNHSDIFRQVTTADPNLKPAGVKSLMDDSTHMFRMGDRYLTRKEAAAEFDKLMGNPPGTTGELHSANLLELNLKLNADAQAEPNLVSVITDNPMGFTVDTKTAPASPRVGKVIDPAATANAVTPELAGQQITDKYSIREDDPSSPDFVRTNLDRMIAEYSVSSVDDMVKQTQADLNAKTSAIAHSLKAQRLVNKVTGVTEGRKPATDTEAALRIAERAGMAGRKAGVIAGKMEAKAVSKAIIGDLEARIGGMVKRSFALREFYKGQEKAGKMASAETKKVMEMQSRWEEAESGRARAELIKFVEVALPAEDRADFTRRIIAATRPGQSHDSMIANTARVGSEVTRRAEAVYRNDIVGDILKMFKRSTDSPSVDIKYKQMMEMFLSSYRLRKFPDALRRKIEASRDYFARSGDAIPEEVARDIELLSKTPISELPTSALEAMREKVRQMEIFGRMLVGGRRQIEATRLQWMKDSLITEKVNPVEKRDQFRAEAGDPMSVHKKISNWLKKRADGIAYIDKVTLPIDAMFDLLGEAAGKYNGALFRLIRNPLDLDTNHKLNIERGLEGRVIALRKKYKMTEQNGERIGIFAISRMEGGRERLIDDGHSPNTIDRIAASMTPPEMMVYQEMRDSMEKIFPKVQAIMRDLYNKEVEKVDDYFPLLRDWSRYDRKPGEAEMPHGSVAKFDALSGWQEGLANDYVRLTSKARSDFVKARQKGAKTPVKIDAFEIFEQHINDAAHFVASQRDLKRIGEFVRSPEFREKYGEVGGQMVMDWLDTYARQGGIGGFRRWKLLDTMRRSSSQAVIGYRILSNFKHSSNIPFSLQRAGPGWYYRALTEVFTPEGKQFMLENFAETFERGAGEPAYTEVARGKWGAFARAGFLIERQIDLYNAQGCTLGVYLRLLSEKGLNPADYKSLPIDREAQAHAMVLSRRAIASPMAKDVPLVLSRGALTGGNVSLGRSIFQFQNIMLDQWSNFRYDFIRAGIREKNPKLAAQMFITLLAVIGTEMGIVSVIKGATNELTGYQPKKKDEELPASVVLAEEFMLDAAKRFPFMGNLISMYRYQGATGIPVWDAYGIEPVKAVRSLVNAKTDEARAKSLVKLVGALTTMSGVPGSSQTAELITKSMP
jgi:hypothetical protein